MLRRGRRWQSYLFRTLCVGAIFAVFATAYGDAVRSWAWQSDGDLSWVGARLFEQLMVGQWTLLCLATPILVAQAVSEERNRGTLELLAISRLTPGQILRGKVLSTLMQLGWLQLSTMPLLVMCTAFGGVGMAQVFFGNLAIAVSVLAIASLSAFFALFSRGPVLPLLCSLGLGLLASSLFSLPGAVAVDREWGFAWTSLVYVAVEACRDPEPIMLGALLLWTLLSLAVLRLTAQLFSALVTGGEEQDEDALLLSLDLWAIERLRRRLALASILGLFSSPLLFLHQALAAPGLRGTLSADWAGLALVFSWCWAAAALFVATLGSLLGARAALLALDRTLRRRRLSAQDRAALQNDGPRTRGTRPVGARQVWGNPVLWRELVTRAHGSFAALTGRVYIVGLVLLGLGVLGKGSLHFRREEIVLMTGLGFVGCVLLAMLMATLSMLEEQRRGTLALLCVTPLGGTRIVLGKVLGVAVHVFPLFAVSSLAALLLSPEFTPGGYSFQASPDLDVLFARAALLILVAGAAVLFVTSAALLVAARARSAGRAWAWNLGLLSLLALGPPLLLAFGRGRGAAADLAGLLNPILNEQFWRSAVPLSVVPSVFVWGVAASLLLGINAATLARVAR